MKGEMKLTRSSLGQKRQRPEQIAELVREYGAQRIKLILRFYPCMESPVDLQSYKQPSHLIRRREARAGVVAAGV